MLQSCLHMSIHFLICSFIPSLVTKCIVTTVVATQARHSFPIWQPRTFQDCQCLAPASSCWCYHLKFGNWIRMESENLVCREWVGFFSLWLGWNLSSEVESAKSRPAVASQAGSREPSKSAMSSLQPEMIHCPSTWSAVTEFVHESHSMQAEAYCKIAIS